jgi:hypothetical protein
MEFREFKTAVQRQFNEMKDNNLFRVNLDKDELWNEYLESFPADSNPMFRKRTEHDCSCCRQFIRSVGDMVTIKNGAVISIWDINVGGNYQVVADAMSAFVKEHNINDVFFHTEKTAGTDKNFQDTDDGVLTWEHLFIQLPQPLVCKGVDLGTKLAESRSTKDVMLRALKEITTDSIDTVLELINQNSLYRGEEHKFVVDSFLKLKKAFDKLKTDYAKDIFCWDNLKSTPTSVSKIRSTVIGTLLVDLSDGVDMERAVASFESKVAPTNYKRPTALVTKAMIDNAKAKLTELGLDSALDRRFAALSDITANNILFADRNTKKLMGDVFDEISTRPTRTKSIDKVEEVTINNFIANILPKIDSMEVMFENKHNNNLVSLIAPVDLTAPHLFKWPNSFSWSYNGEVADSIKERVKSAGGNVTGDVCCRLAWYNKDDLDFHMVEPMYEIMYHNKRRTSPSGGMLDVDANGGDGNMENPVENIFYANMNTMKEGRTYTLRVHQYAVRALSDVGFEVEIDIQGTVHNFAYPKAVKQGEFINVATLQYTKKDGVKVTPLLSSSQSTKEVWGITTQTFHKVSVVMLSPNYWNEKAVGNKHFFFMLEGCLNDGKARGFYNEFLTTELDKHRKVFEIVGSKMKTEESQNQLSGLGFSSTQRNSILCKVKGSFTRTIKIVF